MELVNEQLSIAVACYSYLSYVGYIHIHIYPCDPCDSHDSDISGAFGAEYAQYARHIPPGIEEPAQREMSSTWQDRIDDDWPSTSEGLAMPCHFLPDAKASCGSLWTLFA